jgi:hypothetical protein
MLIVGHKNVPPKKPVASKIALTVKRAPRKTVREPKKPVSERLKPNVRSTLSERERRRRKGNEGSKRSANIRRSWNDRSRRRRNGGSLRTREKSGGSR